MQRHERLEEDAKFAISDIIRTEVKHPDVKGLISVTSVHITPDQKYAKIFVSIYNVDNKAKVLKALKKSISFIQHEFGKRVQMKYVPKIDFELDNSMEYGAHMDRVIDELEKDEENNINNK